MMNTTSVRALTSGRGPVLGLVGLLVATAWLALATIDPSHSALHVHATTHSVPSPPFGSGAVLFIIGWTLMTVAMMLPTSLPVLNVFHAVARQREDRLLLVVLVIVGYLLSWAAFGALVYVGYLSARWLVVTTSWLADHASAADGLILMLAGAYQFTALKYRCLDKCRSPYTFVVEHWQGRQHRRLSFRLGLDHGLFCIGCCWALMLVMFAVGLGSLRWMLLLGAVMAVEKNLPAGRRLSAPLGVSLLVWGAYTLAIAVWSNHAPAIY